MSSTMEKVAIDKRLESRAMYKSAKILCLSFMVLLVVIAQHAQAQEHGGEPISFIGHGGLFDQYGNQIPPDINFVKNSLQYYENAWASRLSDEQKKLFSALNKSATSSLSPGARGQVIVTLIKLQWLYYNLSPRPDDSTLSKFRLLKHYVLQDRDSNSATRAELTREINDWITSLALSYDIGKSIELTNTDSPISSEAYNAQCFESGVPLPRDFSATAWTDLGQVSKDARFIDSDLQATIKMMESNDPPGLCIALPQHTPETSAGAQDGEVIFNGIICMGSVSSKACFWDNKTTTSPENISDAGVFKFPLNNPPPINKWLGGANLADGMGGICSDCHAGENPFVIHPDRGVQTIAFGNLAKLIGDKLYPANWHEPLVSDTWPSPVPVNSPLRCSGCHGDADSKNKGNAGRLPWLSELPGYCGVVLRAAIGAKAPNLHIEKDGKFELIINPPPTMPLEDSGAFACTPNLSATNPNYRPCRAAANSVCTPALPEGADETTNVVHCSRELAELLSLCP